MSLLVRFPRIAVTALLAAVGCASLEPLTRAEFLERADRICGEARRDLEPLVPEFPEEVALDTLPGFAQTYAEAVPILQRELEALRDLPPPEEDEETVERLLEEQERNVGALNDARGAAMKADLEGFRRAFDEALEAAAAFRETASEYGLEVCGQPVRAREEAPEEGTGGGEESEEEQALLDQAPAAATEAGCSDVQTVEPYGSPDEDQAHREPVPPLDTYPSVPPASGPHAAETVGPGLYVEPPPIGPLIHSLEHGAVVIWFDPGSADQSGLTEVAEFFGQPDRQAHVIVAPYSYPDEGEAGRLPDGTSMALVAWHRIQTCQRVSLPVAFAFVASFRPDPEEPQAYRGEAPEPGASI
jgi:hypothetical protein